MYNSRKQAGFQRQGREPPQNLRFSDEVNAGVGQTIRHLIPQLPGFKNDGGPDLLTKIVI